MALFNVGLARTYLIQVEAENIEDALQVVESYEGFVDISAAEGNNPRESGIVNVEIVDNDVYEVP